MSITFFCLVDFLSVRLLFDAKQGRSTPEKEKAPVLRIRTNACCFGSKDHGRFFGLNKDTWCIRSCMFLI